MVGWPSDTELLRLCYAEAIRHPGETGAPPWAPFLEALRDLTRANSAQLVVDIGNNRSRFALGEAPPPPATEALLRLRADRVYAQDEIDGSDQPTRAMRVSFSAGALGRGHAWLAINHHLSEFRAVDGTQLSRLAPHLPLAVQMWLETGIERARARQSETLAQALGAGWLWFDVTGRITALDSRATDLIDALPGLRQSTAGRLEAGNPLLGRDLRRALDLALTRPVGTAPEVLALSPEVSLAILPGAQSPAPGHEPVLRAVIRAMPRASQFTPEALATALSLNRSEARLAARLCDGDTLAEAAEALGWTLETARSTSKRIYAQTGTRGQSDLIRRMLTGVSWFMPA